MKAVFPAWSGLEKTIAEACGLKAEYGDEGNADFSYAATRANRRTKTWRSLGSGTYGLR